MARGVWSALTALAFASSAVATGSCSVQRRNDAPPLPPCTSFMPYTYLGCYYELSPSTLQYNPNLDYNTMTVEICTATCKSNGYRYAGLVYYGGCYCGTFLSSPAPSSDCNAPCNGNHSETCGANQRLSIWQDTTYPPVDQSTIVSQYKPLGCYTEGSGFRALPYRQDQLSSSTLTTEQCLQACGSENYPYAGTEFGGECYCGVSLLGGSSPANSADCSSQCTGNNAETCGGPDRLNVYLAPVLQSNQPCGSSSSSSVSSSPTPSTSSSPPPSSSPTTSPSSSPPPSSSPTTSPSSSPPPSSSPTTSPSSSPPPSSSPTTTLQTSTSTTSSSASASASSGCGSGTAYCYVPGHSQSFQSLGIAQNWGWVITGVPVPPLVGTLYMGAGQSDISKGTVVGSCTISEIGANLVVTYTTTGGFFLKETHLFYGSAPPPKIAPGQFGHSHENLPAGTTADTYVLPYIPSQNTYILHAGIGSAGC